MARLRGCRELSAGNDIMRRMELGVEVACLSTYAFVAGARAVVVRIGRQYLGGVNSTGCEGPHDLVHTKISFACIRKNARPFVFFFEK